MATSLSTVLNKKRKMDGYQPKYEGGSAAPLRSVNQEVEPSEVRQLLERKKAREERRKKQEEQQRNIQVEQTQQYTPALTDLRRQDRQQAKFEYNIVQSQKRKMEPYLAVQERKQQKLAEKEQHKNQQAAQRQRDKEGFTPSEAEGFVKYADIPNRQDYAQTVEQSRAQTDAKSDIFNPFTDQTKYFWNWFDKEKRPLMDVEKYNPVSMTENERDIFYYLKGRYGTQAAANYIKSLGTELNARTADALKDTTEDLGKRNPMAATALDAASAVSSLSTYPVLLVTQAAKSITGDSTPIDPNDPLFGPAVMGEGFRSGMSDNELLKKIVPNQGVRDFAVGTGLSMTENIGRLPLGAAGLAAAAGGAGLAGTRDAVESGGSTGQAVALGAANAAAEAFFEKFSLEGLERFKVNPGRGVKEFLKNMGKQAFTEGSEEVFTEIANTISDKMIMGELSQYDQRYQEYRQMGADDDTAKQEAFKDFLKNVGLAGLGGAVSGGIMGAGGQALGNLEQDAALRQYGKTIDQDYRDYANTIDTNPDSYLNEADAAEADALQKMAQEYADRQRRGEFIKDREKAEYDLRYRDFMEHLQEEESQRETMPEVREETVTGEVEDIPKDTADSENENKPEKTAAQEQQVVWHQPVPQEQPALEQNQDAKARAYEQAYEQLNQQSENIQDEPEVNPAEAYRTSYGENGAKALMDTYDGNTDVSTYNKAFGRIYDAGYHGTEMDIAQRSAILSVLSDEQIKAAYKAGAQDYNADNNIRPQYTKGQAKEGGLGTVSPAANQNQRIVAEHMGKLTGLKINLVDSMENQDSTASYRPGEITISIDSRDFNGSLAHELTHFIKEQSPDYYEMYENIVVEAEMKAKGKAWEDILEDYANRYADAGQELTRQETIEEVMADAAQKFMNDEEFVDTVVKKDVGLAQRIVDFFSDVIDALKSLMKSGSTRAAAKNLEEDLRYYEDARDVWIRGLGRAGESYKAGNEIAQYGNGKYQLNQFGFEEFTEQEKNWWKDNDSIILCNSQQDIMDFYKEHVHKKPYARLYIGKIGTELSERIMRDTGINTKGLNVAITSEYEDSHSNPEKERLLGQTPVTPEILAQLPNIIANYDKVEDATRKKDQKPVLKFEKNIGGRRVAIEYVRSKKGMLELQTMYAWKDKTSRGVSTTLTMPESDPYRTSETYSVITPVDNNIQQQGQKNKGQQEKFQLKEPVEETKDLIAAHNVNEEKLEKMLDYDGIPMPSIAITKAEYGWDDFGDISLIFKKDTIDPANKKNKVYSADAWTPTFPTIEYDVNSDAYYNASTRVEKEMQGKMPDYLIQEAKHFNSVQNGNADREGVDGVVKAAKDNEGMKAAYLASKGIQIEDRVRQVEIPDISPETEQLYQRFLQNIPESDLAGAVQMLEENAPMSEIKDRYGDTLIDAYVDAKKGGGFNSEQAEKQRSRFKNGGSLFVILNHLKNAYAYQENGVQYKTKTVRDTEGIRQEIDSQLDEKGYEEWLRNLYGDLINGKGVYNGTDYYKPNGDRRTFQQTHYEVTPENIVKAMLAQGKKGTAGFVGIGTIHAAASDTMESISDIHKRSNQLQYMTNEEYVAKQKQMSDRLYAEIQDIIKRTGDTGLMSTDNVGSIIQDAAGKKRFNEKTLREEFAKYPYWKVTDENIQKIVEVVNDVKWMPTKMFEAKPERVVGYDEVAAAIVPTTVNENLVDKLEAKGIKVVQYDPNIPGARKEATNKLEDVRFQMDDTEGSANRKRLDALYYENKLLREANDLLEQQFKLTPKDAMRTEDVNKAANDILKEYNSKYPKETLERNLWKLYEYIRSAEQVDGQAVREAAVGIARSILQKSQQTDTELTEQYRDLRNQIRNTKIAITDQDKADLAAAGGYNAFRQQYFGKMKLGKDGISIDSIYQELQGQYPELFPADITHPADELMAIANVIDQTDAQVKNPYSANMDEMAAILGQDIMDRYFDIRKPEPTFADKKEAQLQKLRWQHRQKMAEYKNSLKKQYDDMLKQVRKDSQEQRDRLAQEFRNLSEANQREMKDYYKERMDALRSEKNQKLAAMQQQMRQQNMERVQAMRERRQRQESKKTIMRETRNLQKWLLNPTDSKHIPEELKVVVAEFLDNIDFSSDEKYGVETVRTKEWQAAQVAFKEIIDRNGIVIDENGNRVVLNVDPDLSNRIVDLLHKTEGMDKLDNLNAHDMEELKKTVVSMKTIITNANTLQSNSRSRDVSVIADGVYQDLSGKKDRTVFNGKLVGGADSLINYDMLDAQSMFGLMGDNMKSVYDSLRTGLDKKTVHLKSAKDYVDNVLEQNKITPKMLQEWSGKGAKVQEYEVTGGTIRLTGAAVMSLYELDKRKQAQIHMYDRGDGIKAAERTKKNRLGFSVVDKQGRAVRVSEADVARITETLTTEQKALADALQQFMGNECAAWGNEVSMEMYGYEKFTAKNYFPITTDKNSISTAQGQAMKQDSVIQNMGMTKTTNKYARNAIMIEDIFDVFSRQVDRMSTYNAYVIPLSDLNKVFNYKADRGDESFSIKEEIERTFGRKGNEYIDKLVKDINGSIKEEHSSLDTFISNWKGSAIGGNMRVAIQQPTAYVRAAAEMNAKYLWAGFWTVTKNDQWDMITKYAPIAQWKDWGFYKMDTSRQTKDILFDTDGSKFRKLNELAMVPAEVGDKFAWNRLWRACEYETMDKHRDLKPGTDAFHQEVGRRFSEIIDKTQVVDSTLHRTQIMRSQNGMTKMATSFMAEPLKSYDMMYRAIADVIAKKPGAKRKLAAAGGAYVASAVATALVAALADTWRDDSRDKTLGEKYRDNVKANLKDAVNIFNNIPLAKDIVATLSGDTPVRSDMQGFQDLYYAIREILKGVKGDSKYTPQYIAYYSLMQASKITGLPLGNIMKEAKGMLDTAFNAVAEGTGNRDIHWFSDYEWLKQRYDLGSKENLQLYASMMINARRSGDSELEAKIKADLNQAGIDNDTIGKKIKSLIKAELITDKSVDPRIDMAAQAILSSETEIYDKSITQLMQEGYSAKLIGSAVDKRMKQLQGEDEVDWDEEEKVNPDDLYEDILGGDADDKVERKTQYKTSDLLGAIEKIESTNKQSYNDYNRIVKELYDTKVANGTAEKESENKTKAVGSIKSSITREYKERWVEAYRAGNKKECEAIQNKLKQLKIEGKTIYSGDDWIAWRKAAKEK